MSALRGRFPLHRPEGRRPGPRPAHAVAAEDDLDRLLAADVSVLDVAEPEVIEEVADLEPLDLDVVAIEEVEVLEPIEDEPEAAPAVPAAETTAAFESPADMVPMDDETLEVLEEPLEEIEVTEAEDLGTIPPPPAAPPLAQPVAPTAGPVYTATPVASPVSGSSAPAVPVAMAVPVAGVPTDVPLATPVAPMAMAMPVSADAPAAPPTPTTASHEDDIDLDAILRDEPMTFLRVPAAATQADAAMPTPAAPPPTEMSVDDLAMEALLEESPTEHEPVVLNVEEDRDLENLLMEEPPGLPDPIEEVTAFEAPAPSSEREGMTEMEIDVPAEAPVPVAAMPALPAGPATEPEIDLAELFKDDDVVQAAVASPPGEEEEIVVDDVFVIEDSPPPPPKKG